MASSVIDGNSGNSENGDELQQQQQQRVDLATLVDFAAIRAHFRQLLPNPQQRESIFEKAKNRERNLTKDKLQEYITGITPALRDLAALCDMEAPLPSEVNKELRPVVIERATPLEQQFSKLTEDIARNQVDINNKFDVLQEERKKLKDEIAALKQSQREEPPCMPQPQNQNRRERNYAEAANETNVLKEFWWQEQLKPFSNIRAGITSNDQFEYEPYLKLNKLTFKVKEGEIDGSQDVKPQLKAIDIATRALLGFNANDIFEEVRNVTRESITWFLSSPEKVNEVCRAYKRQLAVDNPEHNRHDANNKLKVTLPVSRASNLRFLEIFDRTKIIEPIFYDGNRLKSKEELQEAKRTFRDEVIDHNFAHFSQEEKDEIHIKHFYMADIFSKRRQEMVKVAKVVIGLTPKMYFEVMNHKRPGIKLAGGRNGILQYIDYTQCKKCLDFGHHHEENGPAWKQCPHRDYICGFCGGNHKSDGCSLKHDNEHHFCSNCWTNNKQLNTIEYQNLSEAQLKILNHTAFDPLHCTTKRTYLANKVREQTAF